MGFIDCDSHVVECDETWDYFDPSERQYRPVPIELPTRLIAGQPMQLYLIGETLCRRFPTDCRGAGVGTEHTEEVSHLRDPAVRLKKMDALGIDVQVVISTNFIAAHPDNPVVEAAVTRSYNRWILDRTSDSGGRLRPLIVVPSRALDRAAEEMEFGKKNGAVGVMMKGVEHGYSLTNPYFYPLYERAQDLDLTISIHLGAARSHIEGLGMTNYPLPASMSFIHTAVVASAFQDILTSDFHERFPRLKFAFIEAGSMWVPTIFHHLMRGRASTQAESYIHTDRGPTRAFEHVDAPQMMREHNMYVACERDDHLPYITSVIGDRQLMMGTDMCHNDMGSDPLAHTHLMERTDISQETARRITDTNGRAAFGIPADFKPTEKVTEAQRREVDLVRL
jgi:predicted TIM-barrel fold metal-dependent hydrolase